MTASSCTTVGRSPATWRTHYPDRPSLFGDDDRPRNGPVGEYLVRYRVGAVDAGRKFMRISSGAIDPGDRAYFRSSREALLGMTLEQYSAGRDAALPALLETCAPLERTLSEQAFLAGPAPAYVDYIVFSVFQWARIGSPRDVLAGRRDRLASRLAGADDRVIRRAGRSILPYILRNRRRHDRGRSHRRGPDGPRAGVGVCLGGHQVRLTDNNPESLKRAPGLMATALATLAEAGEVDATRDRQRLSQAVRCVPSLADTVQGAAVVVEAVVERPDVKTARLRPAWKPDGAGRDPGQQHLQPGYFPAGAAGLQARTIIAHWYTPPYLCDLVDLCPGPETQPGRD